MASEYVFRLLHAYTDLNSMATLAAIKSKRKRISLVVLCRSRVWSSVVAFPAANEVVLVHFVSPFATGLNFSTKHSHCAGMSYDVMYMHVYAIIWHNIIQSYSHASNILVVSPIREEQRSTRTLDREIEMVSQFHMSLIVWSRAAFL